MAGKTKIKDRKTRLIISIVAFIAVVAVALLESLGVTEIFGIKLSDNTYTPTDNTTTTQQTTTTQHTTIASQTTPTDKTILTANFIDVGQGDCALFVSGDETMLIDSGEDEYGDTVLEFMANHGINELDYVVVTHAHTDHMGSMAYIIENINAETIIMSESSESALSKKTYGEFLDTVQNSDADIIMAEPDYTFSFGNAQCRILAPSSVSDEENNNSVVMQITAGDTSFLMTGDAETAVEKEILKKNPDLNVTILKSGHHGSKTSSHKAFIKQLGAKDVIISVGKDNSYGHPTSAVLDRYKTYNMDVYRTDIHGTVTVKCNGAGYTISTEKE